MAHTVAWSHGGGASRACQRQVMLAFPQGDVLITSCTYNTEDRELATVVSHPCFPFHLPRGECFSLGCLRKEDRS